MKDWCAFYFSSDIYCCISLPPNYLVFDETFDFERGFGCELNSEETVRPEAFLLGNIVAEDSILKFINRICQIIQDYLTD